MRGVNCVACTEVDNPDASAAPHLILLLGTEQRKFRARIVIVFYFLSLHFFLAFIEMFIE